MKIYRFILVFVFGVFLYADVMYEMKTTTEGMLGMVNEEAKMRVFIKGEFARMEMTMCDSTAETEVEETTIIITRLDKGLIWTLDDENKEYSETKISIPIDSVAIEESLDIEIPEIKVEKTGNKKKILDAECEEYVVSLNVEAEEGVMHLTQTMWVTQDIPGYEELDNFTKKITDLNMGSSGALGKDSFAKKFKEEINNIEGFPLEVSMSMTLDLISYTMKSLITAVDSIPIHERVFEIPEGYTLQGTLLPENDIEDESETDE